MKVFTYIYEGFCVVERECEVFGYPHYDSAGARQYDNTHFRTWEEAHEKLLRELEAGISLDSSQRTDCLTKVRRLEVQIADATAALVTAKLVAQKRREKSADGSQ